MGDQLQSYKETERVQVCTHQRVREREREKQRQAERKYRGERGFDKLHVLWITFKFKHIGC